MGPNTPANPKPTRVGKGGVQGGASPHGEGPWGVSPHKTKIRGELSALATPPTSGAQYAGKPKAHEGGQTGGPGGRKPPGGGLWGVSPHETIKREQNKRLNGLYLEKLSSIFSQDALKPPLG